eukprot:6800292-Prymnesium_polylepis.1
MALPAAGWIIFGATAPVGGGLVSCSSHIGDLRALRVRLKLHREHASHHHQRPRYTYSPHAHNTR